MIFVNYEDYKMAHMVGIELYIMVINNRTDVT